MVVALGRDLGQVGDAQHLAFAAQGAQFLAHDFGDRAADAGVDFVEDHRRHGIEAQGGHFDGQADARQFAARGDLAQRPRRLAGVGGDQEFAAFGALWGGAGGVQRLQGHGEHTATHAQLAHQAGHGLAQLRGRPGAGLAQAGGGFIPFAGGGFALAPQAGGPFAGAGQALEFFLQLVAAAGQVLERHAVLAGEVVQAGQAVFQRAQAVGVEIEVVVQAFDAGGGFGQLDAG